MSADTPIIEIENLGIAFGRGAERVRVLEDVSLSVARQDFVAIVGPSGVGKSSLLRILAGLLPASSGAVHVSGAVQPGRRRLALVFQEARLMPWRRILGNVEFGLEGLGIDRAQRRARAEAALHVVGLSDYAGRWPGELSGGQRQRVGIARALAVEPDLLLMDEPFGALDAITRHHLQEELLRIWRKTGKSILFVTHDIDEAVYLADRVITLNGNPATIADDFLVDIDRQRRRSSGSFALMVDRVRQQLSEGFMHGAGI